MDHLLQCWRAKSEAAHTDRRRWEVSVREIGNDYGVDVGFHLGETKKHRSIDQK